MEDPKAEGDERESESTAAAMSTNEPKTKPKASPPIAAASARTSTGAGGAPAASRSYAPGSAISSINYGDYEEAGGRAGAPKALPPLLGRKAVTQSPLRPRVPVAQKEQTWRDWSPLRGRAQVQGTDERQGLGKGVRTEGGDEASGKEVYRPRRSMDLSEVARGRPGGHNDKGKEEGEQKGKEKVKEGQAKQEAAAKGDHETKAKNEAADPKSESEDDSDSHSEDVESGQSARRPLLKQKKHRSRKKNGSKKGHSHGHSHGTNIESYDEDYEHLPIYMERVRKVLPVMAPVPQVLGFIAWQVITFILGLSLGIFLSGILPGYNVADVGINSHWWNHDIKKPPFQPPDEMLAPMWIIAFFLAATGMWFVWRRGGWKWNKLATALYMVHLFIFQLWLCIFFFLQELLLALLLSLLGWLVMLVCLITFSKRSYIATGLLGLVFLWKSFIVIDSLVLWWLNASELATGTVDGT